MRSRKIYHPQIYKKGDKIGNIEIIDFYKSLKCMNYYWCKCNCGEIFLARERDIQNNIINSCGHDKIYSKFEDLKGQRIGILTILKTNHISRSCNKDVPYYLAKCDCGNYVILSDSSLRTLTIPSCGCTTFEVESKARTIHGFEGTRFYRIWSEMKRRCNNPHDMYYNNYGGRGITYDPRWEYFENFRDDMYEDYLKRAEEVGDEKLISIDRINSNGNYCKENCQWSTDKEQANNRRSTYMVTIGNKVYPFTIAFEKFAHPALTYSTVLQRIQKYNIDPIIALTIPPMTNLIPKQYKEEKLQLMKQHYVPLRIPTWQEIKSATKKLEELRKTNPWKQT